MTVLAHLDADADAARLAAGAIGVAEPSLRTATFPLSCLPSAVVGQLLYFD